MYYTMFGFQRIGDMVWAFADARGKELPDGRNGRAHDDDGRGAAAPGRAQHLLMSTVPTCVSYDPAYVYELAVVIQDGIRRMYEDEPERLL